MWAEREGAAAKKGSTVTHMIDRYVMEILSTLAAKTQEERHRQSKRLKAVFGAMLLDDVEPHHIAAFLDQRESKVAANREITFPFIHVRLRHALGLVPVQSCTGVRRNTERKRTRYITDAELDTLMENASNQMACIIELAYLTAARKSDLLKIRLSDLRDDSLYILPSKTKDSTGQAMIFTYTHGFGKCWDRRKKLRRRASSMYLFATRDGTPHSVSGFNQCLAPAEEKCGWTTFTSTISAQNADGCEAPARVRLCPGTR